MPLHLEEVSLRDVTLEVTQQIEPMVRKKQLEFIDRRRAGLPADPLRSHEDQTGAAQPVVERREVHEPWTAFRSRRGARRAACASTSSTPASASAQPTSRRSGRTSARSTSRERVSSAEPVSGSASPASSSSASADRWRSRAPMARGARSRVYLPLSVPITRHDRATSAVDRVSVASVTRTASGDLRQPGANRWGSIVRLTASAIVTCAGKARSWRTNEMKSSLGEGWSLASPLIAFGVRRAAIVTARERAAADSDLARDLALAGQQTAAADAFRIPRRPDARARAGQQQSARSTAAASAERHGVHEPGSSAAARCARRPRRSPSRSHCSRPLRRRPPAPAAARRDRRRRRASG